MAPPTGSIQQVCCDTTPLSSEQVFQLPTSNFTFGIVARSSRLVAFDESASVSPIGRFEVDLATGSALLPAGENFTISEAESRMDGFLPFLRLIIGKFLRNGLFESLNDQWHSIVSIQSRSVTHFSSQLGRMWTPKPPLSQTSNPPSPANQSILYCIKFAMLCGMATPKVGVIRQYSPPTPPAKNLTPIYLFMLTLLHAYSALYMQNQMNQLLKTLQPLFQLIPSVKQLNPFWRQPWRAWTMKVLQM